MSCATSMGKEVERMGSSEAKKVLAGFGIAALLTGVALTGCKSGGS